MVPVIQAKTLTKIYQIGHTKSQALNGVSLSVNPAEFLIITGRSGSGKSTFMHQVALLDKPTSGEVYIEGVEATKLSERQRTKMRLEKIGYIFQEYALVGELTALQNVMLPHMMQNSTKASEKIA